MTAALTQLKNAVASTQCVNRGHFVESVVMFEHVKCFKMYVIKMKKKKRNENPEIIIIIIIAKINMLK